MKVWGIIASVLLVAFIGATVWFYKQNSDLKSENIKIKTDLLSAQADKDQTAKKIAAAGKKFAVLTIFFSGTMDQNASNEAYRLIKEMNNETLTADWQAMQNSKPGDTTGNKMMQDLLSAAVADLK